MLKILIRKFETAPKNIFLLDALGALVSAVLLFVILLFFKTNFGADEIMIVPLLIISVAISLFSFCFYLLKIKNFTLLLTTIAVINSIYCLIIFLNLIYFRKTLSFFGIFYFSAEILIICILIFFELQIVKRKKIVMAATNNSDRNKVLDESDDISTF